MPKIIENLPEKLAEEARRQIIESGYGAMTIRSVAKACGVGVGTVYNYYPSKDALVAQFMLEDWKNCIDAIEQCARTAKGHEPVLWSIYDSLIQFMQRHEMILRDENAAASFSGTSGKYHGLLRSQLAAPLRRFCRDDFTADFVAEAMLTWTVSGRSFDELQNVLNKLF